MNKRINKIKELLENIGKIYYQEDAFDLGKNVRDSEDYLALMIEIERLESALNYSDFRVSHDLVEYDAGSYGYAVYNTKNTIVAIVVDENINNADFW